MTDPMHIHFVLHAIAIATVLLIVAFFIFFAAQRSMGFVSGFGALLGTWLIILALIIVAGAVTAPMFGGKPFGLDMPMHANPAAPEAPPSAPASDPAPVQLEEPPAPPPEQ